MESLTHQRVLSVACGLYHTVVVTASGCAMSFGGNESGQLGHSMGTHSGVRPKVINFDIVAGGRTGPIIIKKAACGDLFTLLMTTAGTVYGCGSAAYLGNPLVADEKDVVCPARRVETLLGSQIVDVVAGAEHALALSRENELFGWGNNKHCELGYRSENQTTQDSNVTDFIVDPLTASFHQQLPRKVSFPELSSDETMAEMNPAPNTNGSASAHQILGMAAGGAHSVLWTSGGVLLGAGSNKYGQLALMLPQAETFSVVDLGSGAGAPVKCLMAACGATHTVVLASSVDPGAASAASSSAVGGGQDASGVCVTYSTQVLAFGSNSNGQITGTSTTSLFRTPVQVFPNDLQPRFRGSVAQIDSVLLVAAGGDQSFAVGARCDFPSAPNYYATSIYSGTAHAAPNMLRYAGASSARGEQSSPAVLGFGGMPLGDTLLKKQFSSVASRALEAMNAPALHKLLVKAQGDKANASSESSLLSAALSTVSELFFSPSLLAGSFAVDPAKAETVIFSGGETKAIVATRADQAMHAKCGAAAANGVITESQAIETLTSSMIFDIEGAEQCYTTLMTLGPNAVARLLAALQQSVTELEHAAGAGASNGASEGAFGGWRFGLARPSAASDAATLLPDSAYKVFMLIWQSPTMGNPSMSAELMTRLLKLIEGQQRSHATQQRVHGQEKAMPGIATNKLVAMFLQYPDHLLVSRILKPLQLHLSYHIHAAEGSNANVISSHDSSTVNISIRLLCKTLRWLHVTNLVRPFASPELFYNDGVMALPDALLLHDYKRWLAEYAARAKQQAEQSSKKRKMKQNSESCSSEGKPPARDSCGGGGGASDGSTSHDAARSAPMRSSEADDASSAAVFMETESTGAPEAAAPRSGSESGSGSAAHVEAQKPLSADGDQRADSGSESDGADESDALRYLEMAVAAAEVACADEDEEDDDANENSNSDSSNSSNSRSRSTAFPSAEGVLGTTISSSRKRKARPFCLSAFPFLLSADVKRRVLHAVSFEQQRTAQSQAFFGGLASGMMMFQPWFLLPIQRDHLLQQALIHILK